MKSINEEIADVEKGCDKQFETEIMLKDDGTHDSEFQHCEKGIGLCPICKAKLETLKSCQKRQDEETNWKTQLMNEIEKLEKENKRLEQELKNCQNTIKIHHELQEEYDLLKKLSAETYEGGVKEGKRERDKEVMKIIDEIITNHTKIWYNYIKDNLEHIKESFGYDVSSFAEDFEKLGSDLWKLNEIIKQLGERK